jgi:type VI secretion system protein ImpC
MPPTSTLAAVEIDLEPEASEARISLDPQEPFRLLVAGDFSGGAGKNRRPIPVDRDNFDEVLALFAPQLRIDAGGPSVAVSFRELEDFHPDRLLERVESFQGLLNLRSRVSDPAAFRAAAGEKAKRDPELAGLSGGDLLRRMLGEEPAARPEDPGQRNWERMIRDISKQYSVPGPDPRQGEWVARTDETIASEMRALLHHRTFQALEAAWRGLYFLVRRVNTGENLKIYIVDLPQEELATGDLARALAQESWAAAVGLYQFGPKDEETLARISALAQEANAPFLAGLAPDVVGLDGVFEDLRQSLKARWIGLALPRFLLRLPYGAATVETENFAFEEMPATPRHEDYLWGHPALACALLLAQAFERDGWRMRPGQVSEIGGLPAHIYRQDGESVLKPCAEVLLTEAAANLLLDRGLMPLASIKDTDRIRLVRFQSIARPLAPLAGKWE